jgi:hypothetical protein
LDRTLAALDYLLDEGQYLGRRRIDQMTAADERCSGVRECGCHHIVRVAELWPRVCGRSQEHRLLDRGERGGVGLQPLALEVGESCGAVVREDLPNLVGSED